MTWREMEIELRETGAPERVIDSAREEFLLDLRASKEVRDYEEERDESSIDGGADGVSVLGAEHSNSGSKQK